MGEKLQTKTKIDPELDSESSPLPKKRKTISDSSALYCDFSTTADKKRSEPKRSNPVEQILQQASTLTSDLDSDEDEQKKKIAAAKKLLFPQALAASFPEVVDTLRNERRQEFCPIYNDESPEQVTKRLAKRKPVGSLLSKRIRWDDLKRKREETQRQAQIPTRYGPYGPIYPNQQPSYPNTRQNVQQQQTFANPYEQYYTAVHKQYEQMAQMNRLQQEYKGFWPEPSQRPTFENTNQPYMYPYPSMYYNPNVPSPYTSTDYNTYLNNLRQPPPPPPSEPYPY